jgi:hypothetical protein
MSFFDQPKARFFSLKAIDMTKDRLKFHLVVEVTNPFDIPLSISSVFYSLKISGRYDFFTILLL